MTKYFDIIPPDKRRELQCIAVQKKRENNELRHKMAADLFAQTQDITKVMQVFHVKRRQAYIMVEKGKTLNGAN